MTVDLVCNARIEPAAGGSNTCLVTISLLDAHGHEIAAPCNFDVYLSDGAAGEGLTGATASGPVAAGASGIDLAAFISKKALRVQCTAAGVYVLSITDSAKTHFYPCVQLPNGKVVVGAQLTTGNYG